MKLHGGLFGKGGGSVGNLNFSKVSTKRGKKMSVRSKPIPSNPSTPAQVARRAFQKQVLQFVSQCGPSAYRPFRNAVGRLAGFQSLVNLIVNSYEVTEFAPGLYANIVLRYPYLNNLGDLHFPNQLNATIFTGFGVTQIESSTELGLNGNPNDKFHIFYLSGAGTSSEFGGYPVLYIGSFVRSDTLKNTSLFNPIDIGAFSPVIMIFIESAVSVPKRYSVARWVIPIIQ